jgi:alpha-L-rhamnosidase
MDFLERDNPDYLRTHNLGNSYNDWLAPGVEKTPRELLATAYWAHDAALMAEIAEAIGRADQAAGYRALRAKIGSAFADAFVAPDGQIVSGTQTAYTLGLHMQLIPDESRAAANRTPSPTSPARLLPGKRSSRWDREPTSSPGRR